MITDIRKAEKQDIPVLCEIWKACFSDSEDYIRSFYKENFERIEVLLCCIDGKPVCMLHLLDAEFVNGGEIQKAKYMYAGGTLPEYRKNGCLGALLEYAKERADKTGDALFFKPVSPTLTDYFKGHGYVIDSYFKIATVLPGKVELIGFTDLSYKEYNLMRNSAFADIPYVRWDDEHLRWCVMENDYYSGRTLGVNLIGKEHFIMCYPDSDALIINETDLSLNQLKQISGALCEQFGTTQIKAYMHETCSEGESVISSFVYNTPLCKTYVNLILI
ncbi:MAG: GNAT family N-acetyltransferase [Eubacterium sp.]|nr:GNAT family N-acetyltransferase [Eubacterium sp.]MBR0412182.1 GNAT family N-acetyltransferase [Eubacterium sp.]